MNYLTPKTHNFAKTGDAWTLVPPLGCQYEIQGATMTFDKRIKKEFDFFIRFYDAADNMVYEKIYSSMLDWVLNATEHTEIKGLLDHDLHQIYMNFSTKQVLSSGTISSMSVGPVDGNKLTAEDGSPIVAAMGEYIINMEKPK